MIKAYGNIAVDSFMKNLWESEVESKTKHTKF